VKKSIESPCELCDSPGGDPLWQNGFCRIVLIDDPDYPGFCRVILGRHVKEMTDLAPLERTILMDAVFATEAALRELIRPDKVNLASLGNTTPHLHWHVIPRFRGDRHFPRPIWAEASRGSAARHATPGRDALALELKRRMDRIA
jgi:diadenosine tetraphosphate (Ap4A) HIT family hydrolase